MVEWCPKCRAMLPPGLQECPSCGARLPKESDGLTFNAKDIAWFSLYALGILLIPVLVALGIGILCIGLNR